MSSVGRNSEIRSPLGWVTRSSSCKGKPGSDRRVLADPDHGSTCIEGNELRHRAAPVRAKLVQTVNQSARGVRHGDDGTVLDSHPLPDELVELHRPSNGLVRTCAPGDAHVLNVPAVPDSSMTTPA